MRGLRAQILMSLVLLLAFSGTAEAQAYGRVAVVVSNAAGEPLQGVDVVVTCNELPKFREETTTNKKGKAIVSVTDATKVYNFHFEYEDHQPADLPIKPRIRETLIREVTLSEGQVVETDDAGRIRYSPAERIFNEGVLALKAGDMAVAKTKFAEAVGKDDNMAPAHAALAGVYMEEESYESALASINNYLAIEPGNPNGLFMLYDAQVALGNQDEADQTLKALKEADKGGDTVALIYNAGVAAVKNGNYSSAKARFEEALEMNPELKEAHSALAVIYFTEKSYADSVASAEKHLALDPGNKRSLRIRWDAYRELGDEEKTKAAFRELADADPQVLIVEFYNKGNGLFDSGDTAGAMEQFEAILKIDPEYAMAHYRLGVCKVGAGDTASAKEHLQKFIELAPEDPEVQSARDMLGYLN